MPSIILQGLSLSEFESLLKKLIAERLTEVALQSKQVPTQKENNLYLSRKEAAKRLNLSLPTLAKYSRLGLIPSYKIGSKILFKEVEVDRSLLAIANQKFKA